MKKLSALFILSFSIGSLQAQTKADVLHYRFELALNDENDSLRGKAQITVRFLENAGSFYLDLAGPDASGKGMKVIQAEGPSLRGTMRLPEKLQLVFVTPFRAGDTATFQVQYAGIPADGLIIAKNKYGERTFFGDNWPNRAHYWLPCVDDPADKATVEFMVTAPEHYQVISNGTQVEETNLPASRKFTHWKEDVPLPTKVMVIGLARFAVQQSGLVNACVPVSSWVFPQNKAEGFYDYAQARDILEWFIRRVGPYAYPKLANVQSKTKFGGMENAGAIFYNEYSISGKRLEEDLLVHEIAHQWFGNMATEKSFAHLWLSEGFATYLTHLYWEEKYGKDQMTARLASDREEVLGFVSASKRPVVDTTSNLMSLLNANSYKKGGWFLHMLRQRTGDSTFRNILRTYYAAYAGRNADTEDFRMVAEKVSGQELKKFFSQWLYTGVNPQLDIRWQQKKVNGPVELTVSQLQEGAPFEFTLDISYPGTKGQPIYQSFRVSRKTETFTFNAGGQLIQSIKADPRVSLLAAIQINRR